jgi:alanyl-tRNA synthetase
MTANEIRARFLKFFKERGHAILPSASLVTPDEKGVTNATLFNSAGMQPLVPYLMGEPHPAGDKLASAQKCLRTTDIDDVGDATHATFFEMLGNWSLGAYFKDEAIKLSYEFLTSKEGGLGLDASRLYITVFEGDDNAPRDEESKQIWLSLGIPEERIYFMPAESNWWSAGDNGPSGPDTEMFYDVVGGLNLKSKEEFIKADDEQKVVEIWNDVFMEYEKQNGQVIGKLKQHNVDTGAGLERLTMVMQKKNNIFETDLLAPMMTEIKAAAPNWDLAAARIVADHLRAATFLIADGVIPSNTDCGYVLRRLLRRAVRYADILGLPKNSLINLVKTVSEIYTSSYPEVKHNLSKIEEEIRDEETNFRADESKRVKSFDRAISWSSQNGSPMLTGHIASVLSTTHGLHPDKAIDLAHAKEIPISPNFEEELKEEIEKHRKLSQIGAEQKFAGGLADQADPQVIKYHTATHLLNQALREVLGEGVEQKGSNITAERLRFDFSHPNKMTDEEKREVEAIVNKQIQADLPVGQVILPKAEAEATGARHMFNEKYGDEVSVYYIGDNLATAWSKEFCGGPHVTRTGLLGHFKIVKEESVAAGIRRIKAVLE